MFEPKTFTIPTLIGISQKTVDEHLALYNGYVKNTNAILAQLSSNFADTPDAETEYAHTEMRRRLGFEFGGMRNHEVYFGALENGPTDPTHEHPLYESIDARWGSFDAWKNAFIDCAKTRGVGWASLVYDPDSDHLLHAWIDEQHLGHLTGCQPILMIDMWEHAFVADYLPSGKGKYIEDFFANLNWSVIESNFDEAHRT